MSLYAAAFRHLLLPAYEGLRGRHTLRHLREYEASQWLDPEQIAALQWRKLGALVAHCWQHVPFYRQRWQAIGFEPGDLKSMADWARLPLLDKDAIRAGFEDLKAAPFRDRLMFKATGGSTGVPLRFGFTRESNDRRTAVMWRGYGWAGAQPGRRVAMLWGGAVGSHSLRTRVKDALYHRAFNRRVLDSFRMREDNLASYASTLRSWRPHAVVGYTGPLVRLAQWLVDNGQAVRGPRAVLAAAEALHDFQRPVLEAAFPDARAFNTYGCREFMLIASECGAHDGLHVNADHLVVELVQPTALAGGGEGGQVAVTDLHNWGMPLLRYVNGDLAVAGPSARCACGRGLPRLAGIQGRRLDAIRTPDGRLLPGEFFPHLLKDIPGIRRFQVVQEELAALTLSIVPGPDFDAAQQARVRAEVGRVLGTAIRLELNLVEDIPLTPSGKFRVTVSRLP